MRAYFVAMVFGGVLALSAGGCGHSSSDGSGGASGSSGSSGATAPTSSAQFIAQLCAEFADCCQAAGRPSDGAQCRAFYGAFLSMSAYDAAAGDVCLTDIRASGDKKCGTISMTPPSCSKVFASGGTKKPGEACQDSTECAPSDSGRVDCVSHFVNSATVQQCQLQLPGKAGSSPCIGTVDGNITVSGGQGDVILSQGYLCDVADGLTCDSQTQACVPLSTVGQPCQGGLGQCVASAYCSFPDDVCHARVARGAPCDSDEACQTGDYCEQAGHTCAARHTVGEACTTNAECEFGNCTNQKCGASDDLALAFLCGTN